MARPGGCPLPKWAEFAPVRRRAVRLIRQTCTLLLAGGNAACAAASRTRRGTPTVFPFLPINPIPFRARCARKSKSRFARAARLLGQGKQNFCHPRGRARNARPTVPGRSVAFAQTAAINRTSSALPPFGESANVNCRDVIANQIFHRMWKICLRSRAPVNVSRRG